jgi:class 3 adenylate cyclase/tetratricopeptide (TPR) repeat protein
MECPHCRCPSPAGFRFCGQCGASLEVADTPKSGAEDQAELRHLTVMFCDLVGSVALSTSLGPEEYRELLTRYLKAASAEVERFAGSVGQYLGDGMLVYFGYPRAREDSALLGVRCGLGILRAIGELNREFATELRVRIGLHTGLVVVGELGFGPRKEPSLPVGKVINIAARLQALAQPGTVVISGDTWKLVGAHFHCTPLGAQAVKGLAAPLEIYEVHGDADRHAARVAARELTPLFGRDQELERLRGWWAEAVKGGAPRAALLGEAGIGKSRLVREFIRGLDGQPHFCLIARGAPAAQNSAFEPLLQLLREQMKIAPADGPEEQLAKIVSFVAEWEFPDEIPALLAAFLCPDAPSARTLSPAAARLRLMSWLPAFLVALAARQPVVFVGEDLHWFDPSTLETLVHLFAAPPLPRVFFLLTARAEFSPPWLPPETIALERLPALQVTEFAEAIGGGKELPGEIVRQILAKANGVPLFIEEMTKMVLETGLLVERETHFETRAALPPMAIPDTLHELLMARLDGPATVREVAQIASVLGQRFHYSMLRSLYPAEEQILREQLAHLVQAGLFSQEGEVPEATFAFRHALIQAEAYQSLLRRKRQHYHERIAGMLAERFPETLRQQPELVAHHYTEAGRHAEAIDFWLRAATRSEERSANAEAIAQADQGLALIGVLESEELRRDRELSLTVVRGRAAAMLFGYAAPEVERTYSRARDLCREGTARADLYQVLGVLHAYFTARAEFALGAEISEQMMSLGASTGYLEFIDNGWLSRGINAFYLGQIAEALRCFDQALEHYSAHRDALPTRTLDIKVAALAWGGLAHILSGRPDEGLAWSRQAQELALELGHLHSIGLARHFLQLAHYWREEPRELLAASPGFAEFCREQGFIYWLALGMIVQGWALVRLRLPDGLALVTKGLNIWKRTGARLGATQHFGVSAEALALEGNIAEGQAAIEQAEGYERTTGERCYSAHVAELKGALALRESPPDPAAAERIFRAAIAAAEELGTSWLGLRAALPLARLLAETQRPAEARALLDRSLRQIVGGSDTPTIQNAQRLLAELAKTES